jgi:hypothetical protein
MAPGWNPLHGPARSDDEVFELRNARDLRARRTPHACCDGETRVRDIDTRSHYIGAPPIHRFVRAPGD